MNVRKEFERAFKLEHNSEHFTDSMLLKFILLAIKHELRVATPDIAVASLADCLFQQFIMNVTNAELYKDINLLCGNNLATIEAMAFAIEYLLDKYKEIYGREFNNENEALLAVSSAIKNKRIQFIDPDKLKLSLLSDLVFYHEFYDL